MKPHQISAFFLLMTVLLSFTLADERLYVFCEAAALQEPTTHWQEISSGIMHTTADRGLLTSSHKEDRQSRLAASPARPETPKKEKMNQTEHCCFKYLSGRLRMDLIAGYEETRRDCPKPGIIFYTTDDKEVCVDPSAHWVQQVKQKLDHQ